MITENTERSAFIEQNLGLVHSCAGRFRGRGIEYDDLYSDRTVVEASYEVGRAKVERGKTQDAFAELCEQINALGRVNGMEPYKDLSDFINRTVDAARITAQQRSTMAQNTESKAAAAQK